MVKKARRYPAYLAVEVEQGKNGELRAYHKKKRIRWADPDSIKLREEKETLLYGHTGTIHGTRLLNIEVDKDGNPVSVWFRCLMLPFDVHRVDNGRAAEMRQATKEIRHELLAVEVTDPK